MMIGLSERNKKVAINRWNKIFEKERRNIAQDALAQECKAILCGFISGDGSLQERKVGKYLRYQLDFFPDDKIMLSKYLEAMNYVYKKQPLVQEKKNYYAVRLTSKVISLDLMNLSKFGLKKWEIPNWIISDKKLLRLWIKAFFSAEAYVGEKSIKIQTVNEKGMTQLKKYLLKEGIDCNFYIYDSKNENHSTVFIIMITKKQARKKFLEKIGFFHDKKTRKLKESLGL